jgi:hypothetical protein
MLLRRTSILRRRLRLFQPILRIPHLLQPLQEDLRAMAGPRLPWNLVFDCWELGAWCLLRILLSADSFALLPGFSKCQFLAFKFRRVLETLAHMSSSRFLRFQPFVHSSVSSRTVVNQSGSTSALSCSFYWESRVFFL